jgi:hypothetical protein
MVHKIMELAAQGHKVINYPLASLISKRQGII